MGTMGGDVELGTIQDLLANHAGLLELLADQPRRQADLVERLAKSQPSVSRAVAALVDNHLVVETGEEYRITLLGRQLLTQYQQWQTDCELLLEAAPVLRELPPDWEFDPAVIRDSEYAVSTPQAPDAACLPVRSLFGEATSIRGVAHSINVSAIEVLENNHALEEVEIVVGESVTDPIAEYLDTYDISPRLADALTLYRSEEVPAFRVYLVETPEETHLALVTTDEAGVMRSALTTNRAACERVDERLEAYKASAERWRLPTTATGT